MIWRNIFFVLDKTNMPPEIETLLGLLRTYPPSREWSIEDYSVGPSIRCTCPRWYSSLVHSRVLPGLKQPRSENVRILRPATGASANSGRITRQGTTTQAQHANSVNSSRDPGKKEFGSGQQAVKVPSSGPILPGRTRLVLVYFVACRCCLVTLTSWPSLMMPAGWPASVQEQTGGKQDIIMSFYFLLLFCYSGLPGYLGLLFHPSTDALVLTLRRVLPPPIPPLLLLVRRHMQDPPPNSHPLPLHHETNQSIFQLLRSPA